MLASFALWIVVSAAVFSGLMPAVALASLGWVRRRERAKLRPVDPASLPPITILRPCEGAAPQLEEALSSSFTASYPAARKVVVCTPREDDAATEIARRACARAPETPSLVVFDRPDSASFKNPKVKRLFAGAEHVETPLVVHADADVILEGDVLVRLASRVFELDAVGIYAAPIVLETPAWGSRVLRTVLGGTLHAFPLLHALTDALGGAPPASGALMLYRTDALPAEGYRFAADRMGDDLAIGAELAKRGEVLVALDPVVCDHEPIPLASARALLRRWAHVAAAHAPGRWVGYPMMFAATPWLLGLSLSLSLSPLPLARTAAAFCGAGAALRLALALVIRRFMLREKLGPRSVLDTLVGEAMLLDSSMRGALDTLLGREIPWRRRLYRVARGGAIVSVREAPLTKSAPS